MNHILAKANVSILQQFAWTKVVLAFDYDGTLAPIVSEPSMARMRPRTRALLTQLALHYPCVVITGRSRADAIRLLAGIRLSGVVGNHGIEPRRANKKLRSAMAHWRPIFENGLADFSGVHVEDKEYSLALHYRQSRKKKMVRAAILRIADSLGSCRVIGGKQVINILPLHAPHKGMALEKERTRLQCDAAIYVGDDDTDEDAFVLDQPGRLLSVRVGAKRASSAAFFIRSQAEIDRFLQVLLALRHRASERTSH